MHTEDILIPALENIIQTNVGYLVMLISYRLKYFGTGTAGACLPPRFNLAALNQDECVRCFCFGHTETCYSSNLQISQVTLASASCIYIP